MFDFLFGFILIIIIIIIIVIIIIIIIIIIIVINILIFLIFFTLVLISEEELGGDGFTDTVILNLWITGENKFLRICADH